MTRPLQADANQNFRSTLAPRYGDSSVLRWIEESDTLAAQTYPDRRTNPGS